MNIYLSEFSAKRERTADKEYRAAIEAVVSVVNLNNLTLFRSNIHDGYFKIEKRINLSSLFIALIDNYWESSSWKGFEYTYASGGLGMSGDARGNIIPMKMVYLCEDYEFPKYLKGCPGRTKISRSIPELQDQLIAAVESQ